MSLIRPVWLDDLISPRSAASPKLRGLKAFDPQQVPAFQDPLYADDPQFWILAGNVPGVAANLSKVGVQTPADDALVCVVDGCLVSSDIAQRIAVQVIIGSTLLLALTTDTSVTKRNRGERSRSTGVERTGLLRIIDSGNAFVGTDIGGTRVAAGAAIYIPLGFRLYGSEQLWAVAGSVNTLLEGTFWGRLTSKGQR